MDPSKVAPIDPTKFPDNPKGDMNFPATENSWNNNEVNTNSVSIAGSYQIRADESHIYGWILILILVI